MKTSLALIFLVGFCQTAAKSLAASIQAKPGLWEINISVESAALNKAMAALSPEARKKLQEMQAKHGIGANGGPGSKVCYSKDVLDRVEIIAQSASGMCEHKVREKSSSVLRSDFTCNDGTSGTSDFVFDSPTSFSGKIKSTKNSKVTEVTQTARFLGTDCGDVKPLTLPK